MEDQGYYYVKNWWKYQGYRRNRPSWIRLWTSLPDGDADFTSLSEIDQYRLIKLWIYSSEIDGRLPRDHRKIGRRLGLYHRKNSDHFIAILLSKGFISNKDIRGVRNKIRATETETETETYTKTEKEKTLAPNRQKAPDAEPPFWQGQILFVTRKSNEALAAAFPSLNLTQEYAKADAWLVCNPAKRKKDLLRFLNNWLSIAQGKVDFSSVRRTENGKQLNLNADIEGLVEEFDRKRAQKVKDS